MFSRLPAELQGSCLLPSLRILLPLEVGGHAPIQVRGRVMLGGQVGYLGGFDSLQLPFYDQF